MPAAVQGRCSLRCEDACTATDYLSGATSVFANNFCWPDEINEQLCRHVSKHAPKLEGLATTTPLPDPALEAAGLVLVRRAGIETSYVASSTLFVYRRQPATGSAHVQVITDASYLGASSWSQFLLDIF
jgi:hypothetical protein